MLGRQLSASEGWLPGSLHLSKPWQGATCNHCPGLTASQYLPPLLPHSPSLPVGLVVKLFKQCRSVRAEFCKLLPQLAHVLYVIDTSLERTYMHFVYATHACLSIGKGFKNTHVGSTEHISQGALSCVLLRKAASFFFLAASYSRSCSSVAVLSVTASYLLQAPAV